MPTIYQLKSRFQSLLRPLVRQLHAAGITANQVTFAACAGSLAIAGLVAACAEQRWLFALIPLWMFLRMALNAIDGMLAREFGQQSTLGAYLNELCDLVSDTALYLPFLLLPGVSPFWLLLVAALALLSEYAGVMGPLAGASRRYDGPMGKSDRAFCFGALGAGVAAGFLSAAWINGVLIGLCALSLLTLVNRVRLGMAEVAGQG